MKEITYEKLLQEIKEQKQKIQLVFVNDLLDKIEHLAIKTNRVDYETSNQETFKILQIKNYIDVIVKNIYK